ncbi:hypothetical protein [Actinocorallia longicatena]|uniref:Nucleotide exchange factor GrpE n=1 Tax=Actinocorallia longicatena TaxID=111803 RepID=A0ABP6QIQ1_9ACTN
MTRVGDALLSGLGLVRRAQAEAALGRARRERDAVVAELVELRRAPKIIDRPEQPPEVAMELIVLADRLADLPGRDGGDQGGALLRWLDGRVRAMFAACEVTTIEERGPVDPLRHQVVGARAAGPGDPLEHVAETVRPGYLWRDVLLRPQQVVAFVEEEDAP